MSNINKQDLRYGDNVLWFLNELAAYDASDIDAGEFDVYGEDRNGLECCSTIDVTELAADAAKLIEAAEKRIAELQLREVVLPQCYSMLHRVDFDEPYHTEMVYRQHQVLEALHNAGINVTEAGKGEAS